MRFVTIENPIRKSQEKIIMFESHPNLGCKEYITLFYKIFNEVAVKEIFVYIST